MRICFTSFHNYLDFSSGAAISTREICLDSVRRGHTVSILCGPLFDSGAGGKLVFFEFLEKKRIPYSVDTRRYILGGIEFLCDVVLFKDEGVNSTVFFPTNAKFNCSREEYSKLVVLLYAALLNEFLEEARPEICMTYGGYRFVRLAAIETRKRGIKNVFFLHNLSYGDASLFSYFDAVVVPSEFARRYYKERLGIDCYVIPPLINRRKIYVEGGERKYVTLVNPSVEKGVFFFLGLAREIGQTHPEIPFLLVEGRAKASSLVGVSEVRRLKNLSVMRTVSDSRSFWEKTRVLLVPSTCKETFCRLVAEAAFNSTPVIASDRGAIPETMGDVSRSSVDACLSIPSRFTPSFRAFPTTREVEPWRQSLLHVLQDDDAAKRLGRILNENAQRFDSLLISERIERFFVSLLLGNTQAL